MKKIKYLNRQSWLPVTDQIPKYAQALILYDVIDVFYYPYLTDLQLILAYPGRIRILFVHSKHFLSVANQHSSNSNLPIIVFCCSADKFENAINAYNTRVVVITCELAQRVLEDIKMSHVRIVFVGPLAPIEYRMNEFFGQKTVILLEDGTDLVKVNDGLSIECQTLQNGWKELAKELQISVTQRNKRKYLVSDIQYFASFYDLNKRNLLQVRLVKSLERIKKLKMMLDTIQCMVGDALQQ